MNNRGVVLIACYLVIAALTTLGVAFLIRSISERSVASKYFDSTQAFWLAEAGANQALFQLRKNYEDLTDIPVTTLAAGQYSATISSDHLVTASGFIPSAAAVKIKRVIEATVIKRIPSGFYDHAIYAAGDLVRKGDVTGDVVYAGTASGSYKNEEDREADRENNLEEKDTGINPLALLDFAQIKTLSQAQGNFHDSSHLSGPFPASFWYDAVNKIPNVIFLEGNLTIKGNTQVAGFFVVGGGGNVVFDATVSGTASIDGCVYTRGNLTNNGGGDEIFNLKGVWVGGTTTLGGSSVITYDEEYMNAIEALGINADVQITSWRETQSAY